MNNATIPPVDADVQTVLDSYPKGIRRKMLTLRKLIYTTAHTLDVGPLTETLKWSEPSYLTEYSKSGSTIRMAWKASAPNQYALYFNCQTNLVDTFRTLFPELTFEGNRAVVFDGKAALPREAVKRCIGLALTYHRDKRKART